MVKHTTNFVRRALATATVALCALPTLLAQSQEQWKPLEKAVNFFVANDLGRNGYYDQRPIADLMGRMAEQIDIECVAAPGDVHHFWGVRSVSDPLWMTNFETIYAHPELMIPWYPLCGNHEYRGNTQAVVDYSKVSARWMMPSRYYSRVLRGKGVTVRLVMIDTTPMIDKYRDDTATYPDAAGQDYERQLAWIDSTLAAAKEDWVVVLGHHPVYADTNKDNSERKDLQQRLNPILRRHSNVGLYVCGHIHNFQHIRRDGIDYVVNTSGSLSRQKVKPIEGTQFCSGLSGVALVCADKASLALHLIDSKGNVVYTVAKSK